MKEMIYEALQQNARRPQASAREGRPGAHDAAARQARDDGAAPVLEEVMANALVKQLARQAQPGAAEGPGQDESANVKKAKTPATRWTPSAATAPPMPCAR